MPIFQVPPNPILDHLHQLHSKLENSGLKDEALADCKTEIEALAAFFNCKTEEAVVFSLLLQMKYNQNTVSVGELLEYLEMKPSAAVCINDLLQVFVSRDWIQPARNVKLHPQTEYEFSARLVSCVTMNDWSLMEKKFTPAKTAFQLLDQFSQEFKMKKRKKLPTESITPVCNSLIKASPNNSLSKYIRKEKIKGNTLPMFLKLCLDFYNGKSGVNIKGLADDFFARQEDRYCFMREFEEATHVFLTKGLLSKSEEDFFSSDDYYEFTDKLIQVIDPKLTKKTKLSKCKLLDQKDPATIEKVDLVFQPEQQEAVEKLNHLLMPGAFQKMMDRFRQKNMKPGISILLYGNPGTGKTETVYQLARSTGRLMLMADASKIRDKWVGETEKNIRELFVEYRKMKTECAEVPILLFNEADAVLGKRRAVNDRGDQMENSLQNILLEELENFEGIFVATTNMETNFDKAFDRRFLYKIQFENPGLESVRSIWKSKFPEMDDSFIKVLAENFSLTGAQIENIRKKSLVDFLLETDFVPDLDYYKKLAREETNLRNPSGGNRGKIGFNRVE